MEKELRGALVGLVIGILLGVGIAIDGSGKIWHENVIKQGHGKYNELTGNFEFLTACRKDE